MGNLSDKWLTESRIIAPRIIVNLGQRVYGIPHEAGFLFKSDVSRSTGIWNVSSSNNDMISYHHIVHLSRCSCVPKRSRLHHLQRIQWNSSKASRLRTSHEHPHRIQGEQILAKHGNNIEVCETMSSVLVLLIRKIIQKNVLIWENAVKEDHYYQSEQLVSFESFNDEFCDGT